MLNITNYQESANQNPSDVPPHTCQNAYYQKDQEITSDVGMWREGTLCSVSKIVSWYGH